MPEALHTSQLRVGIAFLTVMREVQTLARLIEASGGDVEHAARVYEQVTRVRLRELRS